MKRHLLLSIPLFFALAESAVAQSDTLNPAPIPLLLAKRLDERDLVPIIEKKEKIQIVSGSRFPTAAGDLPFSIYVITKEEIRQNGYETLVDALKMAPGIRVSQPGNAIEGETFGMRGLPGNAYAKILINDVPIKPAFVAGMPIGAQLPIKEAERIEVIYGAGAALYGSDASAGVINIITRQSEKPVFMQADLSVGEGLYSSVNVMFGGKIGRDKNILRYFAYASNVLLEKRDIFYDTDYNYNPKYYPDLTKEDTSFVLLDNYAGTAEKPLLTNTPHLSRKFGTIINFRRYTFSLESMYRRDHSALGLNPVAVSYRNPLTYTGEGIVRLNVNLFKNKEKWNRKTDFTFLLYRLDDRSSSYTVQNQLVTELQNVAHAVARSTDPTNIDSLQAVFFKKFYNRYFDGLRYQFASSEEIRIEHVRNYRILKRFTLTMGVNGKAVGGIPFTGFLSRPDAENGDIIPSLGEDIQFDSLTYPIMPVTRGLAEGNLMGQLFYNGKKFNLAAGANYAGYTVGTDEATENTFNKLSPRFAGIWNFIPNANLRASWGKAFRIPNEFYKSLTYVFDSEAPRKIDRRYLNIKPESTTSWEAGIRLKSKRRVSLDVTWFLNKTTNLIGYGRYGGFIPPDDSIHFLKVSGYNTFGNSFNQYKGGQLVFLYEMTNSGRRWVDGQWNFSWIKSTQSVAKVDGAYAPERVKGNMHQLRVNIYPTLKTTVIFDVIRFKNLGRTGGMTPKTKFSTIDFSTRYALNDRFDVYLKIVNVLNQKYSGFRAANTPDNLIYNPQTGFFMRVGMNYNLE